MHQCYQDIMYRAGQPQWFDENAVPRYGCFAPDRLANTYAREAALVRVNCRSCGTSFDVAFSWPSSSPVPRRSIAERIPCGQLNSGDPPNVKCCVNGPYVGTIAKLVIEYWRKAGSHRSWIREKNHELDFSKALRG